MYEEMIQFVKQTLESRQAVNPPEFDMLYPFRNRFQHSLRVYQWALRLQEILGGDAEIIAIAAIFHDVGKGAIDRPHAEVGAEIADTYLRGIGYPDERRERVVSAVRNHSSKRDTKLDLSLEEQIIMDADGLDEAGAIAVVWDAMAVAMREENPSYTKVLERIQQFYHETRERPYYFHTDVARQMYEERLRVREKFAQELRFELGG